MDRALCLYSRRRTGRQLPEVAETPLKLLNALTQCPLKALCIRYARLKAHTPIVRLAQEPLEFRNMAAEALDDGIGRLLKLLFQLFNGFCEILIFLLAVLTPMKDIANNEQQNGAENDECTQNFGDGNNGRMPPLLL